MKLAVPLGLCVPRFVRRIFFGFVARRLRKLQTTSAPPDQR
jgi:hypothetical protein